MTRGRVADGAGCRRRRTGMPRPGGRTGREKKRKEDGGPDRIRTACYDPPPAEDPWCSGPTCQPVTLEIAGSNPVGSAISHRFFPRPVRPPGQGVLVPGGRSGRLRYAAARDRPRPAVHPERRRARRGTPSWLVAGARRGARHGRRHRLRRRRRSRVFGSRRGVTVAGPRRGRDAPRPDAPRRPPDPGRAATETPGPSPPVGDAGPARSSDVAIVPVTNFRSGRSAWRRPTSARSRAATGRTRRSPSSSEDADAILAALGLTREDLGDSLDDVSSAATRALAAEAPEGARVPPRGRRRRVGALARLGRHGAVRRGPGQVARRDWPLVAQLAVADGRDALRPGDRLDHGRRRRHPPRPRRRPRDQGERRRLPVRRRHGGHHGDLQGLLAVRLGPAVHGAHRQQGRRARPHRGRGRRDRELREPGARTPTGSTARGPSFSANPRTSRASRTPASTGSRSPTTTSATPAAPGCSRRSGTSRSTASRTPAWARTRRRPTRPRCSRSATRPSACSATTRSPPSTTPAPTRRVGARLTKAPQGRHPGRAQGRRRPRHRHAPLGHRVPVDAVRPPAELARYAIDAGADMVIGNHAHWAGAMEV